MAHKSLFSKIIYNSWYTILYIILISLLLITPADIIQRSVQRTQIYNIWILAAAYVLVVTTVSFVYATRLYINKTDLASIPKGWVPVERGDVRSRVYRMIQAGLVRSAEIAFKARPRLQMGNGEQGENDRDGGYRNGPRPSMATIREEGEAVVSFAPRRPVWGEIEHYGWASPNAPDLPNLQYCTVVSELPNLIEAKAVTLAPPDPYAPPDSPALDADAVALLQRAPNMDLRNYIDQLTALGVLHVESAPITTDFLSQYEYARFSKRPISNARFKQLMHIFAEVLRVMQPLNPNILDDGDSASFSSGYADDASSNISPTASRRRLSPTDASSIHGSIRRNVPGSSYSAWNNSTNEYNNNNNNSKNDNYNNNNTNTNNIYRTAPNSVRSRVTGAGPAVSLSRKSSVNSFAQPRRLDTGNLSSNASIHSKVSVASWSGSSSGSVIRLATRQDSTELPYVLSLKDTFNP